jgi:hypothetical protein
MSKLFKKKPKNCAVCGYQAWSDARKKTKKTTDIDRAPTYYDEPTDPSTELRDSAEKGCLGCQIIVDASEFIHETGRSRLDDERPSEVTVSSGINEVHASVVWIDTGGASRGLCFYTKQGE